MYIYVVMYFLLTFGWIMKKNVKRYAILIGVFLFIIVAFRSFSIGADTLQYKYRYDNIASIRHLSTVKNEPGYMYFTLLFSNILKLDYRYYVVLTSLFIIWSAVYFFYKSSENIYISLLMYVSLGMLAMNMSGLRQSIAIGVILLSIKYIEQRKFMKFVFLILFASSFHNSAIVFLFAYLLSYLRVGKITAYICVLLSAGLNLFSPAIIPLIEKVSPKKYQSLNLMSTYKMNPLLLILPIIITLVSIYFISVESDGKLSQKNSIFFFLACEYIGLYALAKNNMNFTRVAFYFYAGNCILLPSAIESTRKKIASNAWIIENVFTVICILYFMISLPGGTLQIDKYSFM